MPNKNAFSGQVRRVNSLDAFRGFAILTMIMSSWITFAGLPGWMFHAQIYDPQRAGITWVDLVFPFFIFSMGVAIPLSLRGRIARGSGTVEIMGKAFHRYFFLLAFAIYNMHFQPGYIAAPDIFLKSPQGPMQWVFALVGFVLMFGIWGVFPGRNISKRTIIIIRIISLILAVTAISLVTYTGENPGFTVFRYNVILHKLATLALAGTVCWYISRNNMLFRALIILALFAWRMLGVTGTVPFLQEAMYYTRVPFLSGWIETLSGDWPSRLHWAGNFSWLTQPQYFQYLQILLPATFAGDFLYKWMNRPQEEEKWPWTRGKTLLAAMLLLLFIPVELTALFGRYLKAAYIVTPLLLVCSFYIFSRSDHRAIRLIRSFVIQGGLLLVIGLILEPLEGGIRKEPVTVSYFYVTAGISFLALGAFILLVDILEYRPGFRLLIDNGKNPMIAYCGDTNFFTPIIQLLGLGQLIFMQWLTTGWVGSLRVILVIGSIALMVRAFTRNKIYLKS